MRINLNCSAVIKCKPHRITNVAKICNLAETYIRDTTFSWLTVQWISLILITLPIYHD